MMARINSELYVVMVIMFGLLCSCSEDEVTARAKGPDYVAISHENLERAVNSARAGNHSDAVLAYSRAAYAGELAQSDDTASMFYYDDISVALRNAGLYRRSLELLDSLSVMADVDSLFVDFSRGILLEPLLDPEQCDYDTTGAMGHSRYMASVCYASGDVGGAMAWLDSMAVDMTDDTHDVYLLRAMMSMSAEARPTAQSLKAYTYLLHYQDSVLALANKETMDIVHRNARRAYGLDDEAEAVSSGWILWWGVVILMVAAGMVIWTVRLRSRRALLTERRLMAEINALNDKLKMMAKDHFSTVNALCERFCPEDKDAAPRVNEKLKLTVYSRVKEILDGINSPSGRMRMEEWVNSHNADIMTVIRREMPQLNNDDVTMLVFLYAGLSSKSICMFLSITSANFYKRKQRLRTKISESDAEHRDWFLNMMNPSGT